MVDLFRAPNEDGEQGNKNKVENRVEKKPFDFKNSWIPLGITIVFQIFTFYGYVFEPDAMPGGIVKKMDSLANKTDGERNLFIYFKSVADDSIKKSYKRHCLP